MAGPEQIAALRQLLARRFPSAAAPSASVLPTELPALDGPAGGGLPAGALTEIVSAAPSSGGQLLIDRLLAVTRLRRVRVALVDGGDAFDPSSHEAEVLQHLVWVRCGTLPEALGAADLLARDANLALLLLDLRGVAPRELRAVPATTWYRLQRALGHGGTALLALTTVPVVSSAALRFVLGRSFALGDLEAETAALLHRLPAAVQRSRLPAERRPA